MDNVWTNASGNWNEPSRWSLGHVPTSGENARLGADADVLLDGTARADGVVVGFAGSGALAITSGASFVASNALVIAETAADAGEVGLFGGTAYVHQRVEDGPVGCSALLSVSGGYLEVRGIDFDGGGTITVSGGELHIFGTNNNQLKLENGSALEISGDGVLAWHWGNKVATLAGLIDDGKITWDSPGSTMLYDVWDQSWTNTDGEMLYACNDGGIVYAWTSEQETAGTLTINCAAAEFPPLVQKLHGGSFFIRDDNQVVDWIDRDGELQMPIYRANMRDCRENYALNNAPSAYIGNDPSIASNPRGLLYLDGTHVLPNFDLSLDALRAQMAGYDMIHYIRWDGAPYMATLADDGLFRSPIFQGGKDPDGDSSPPPHADDRLRFTQAIGDFAAHLNANESEFRPTIWSFWQEPDHTLGDPGVPYGVEGMDLTEEEKQQNIRMFVRDMYRHLALEVRAADPDYRVSGIAQNSSAAEWDLTNYDQNGPRIGGGRLGHTLDEWVMQEKLHDETYPLDYFSLQLYQGNDMEQFHIPNSRYALKNLMSVLHPAYSNRFDRTPVFITEYNYVKQDDEWSAEIKYNLDDAKFREVTENWVYILSQPDIAYATLQDVPHDFMPYRCRRWLEAYADMPEMRVAADSSSAHINTLASYDPDLGLYAFIWNPSGVATSHVVQVDNCGFDPGDTVFYRCALDGSDNGIWQAKTAMPAGTGRWVLTTATNEIVFMANTGDPNYFPGDRTRSRKVLSANYGSHAVLVPRINAQEIDPFGRPVPPRPKGMGHYDQINGRLTVGTDGASGVGLAGVVLRDVTDDYLLRLDLESLGISSGSLRIRIDYLDGEDAVKSVTINEAALGGSSTFGDVNWFAEAAASVSKGWNFLAGGSVLLPLGDWKPAGWATAGSGRRRVRISLFLADVPGKAVLTAALSDQSSYAAANPAVLPSGDPFLNWEDVLDASYTVWSTTNLHENFQPVETGLPENVYTGSIPGKTIFYKITADGE
ncbi:hypothetical protein PDESU_01855 [Pontiella desulfatans]|uniref:Uncharacterized protein n=2 Tax=Pontiella desulfatans TaxID=2750659 RepID=A0A6C2U0F4_PONDE|nr:hypothetical protein PDESU_01855 [Pontiella desulfatans]